MPVTSYAIALGSNRRHGRHGAPARVIAAAAAALAETGIAVAALSPVLRTVAMGPAGRDFANAAAIVTTELDPPALLACLKRIERAFGRGRGRRWGPRVLDLDIVLWSGGRWRGGRHLSVPHRDVHRRGFVLVPLAAVAPDWRHPATGLAVRHLLGRLQRARPVDPSARRP